MASDNHDVVPVLLVLALREALNAKHTGGVLSAVTAVVAGLCKISNLKRG